MPEKYTLKGAESPTSSPLAESAVCGSMMVDAAAVVKILGGGTVLTSDMFHFEETRLVFEAIKSLADEGRVVDLLTVHDQLEQMGVATRIGGLTALHTILEYTVTAQNVLPYADIVRRKWVVREIRDSCLDTAHQIQEGHLTDEEAIERLRTHAGLLERVSHEECEGRWSFEAASELLDIYEAEERGEVPPSVPTGIRWLDEMTGGMRASQLLIIGGRPGGGKTALALQIAFHAAAKGHPVLFFEIEMDDRDLASRLLSLQTGISSRVMAHKEPHSPEIKQVLNDAVDYQMLHTHLKFNCKENNIAAIRMRARQFASEAKEISDKPPLIVVDYLQKVNVSAKLEGEFTKRVSVVSGALKDIAQELSLPVLALSQLKRPEEKRRKPELSDVRWSGEIEQDAHWVLLLSEDPEFCYDNCPDDSLPWLLLLRKNRNGPTGELGVNWNKPIYRFEEF